jgi:hypothetical protein
MTTLRRIYEKPWAYDVLVDEQTTEYYLDVVAGGVGMYVVRIHLTPEDVASFRQNPSTLDGLARQVSYDPDQFAERRIKIDG